MKNTSTKSELEHKLHSLWVLMMCQYRSISQANVISLVSDVGGDYAHVGTEDIRKISVSSTQFFHESKNFSKLYLQGTNV